MITLVLQNNKIITVNQYTTYIEETIIGVTYIYFLVRYNQDGSLDKTFGDNGTKVFVEKTENNLYFYVKIHKVSSKNNNCFL